MYVLAAFMFGVAIISVRAARRDRRGLTGLHLFCACVLVAGAYFGALRLV